MEDISVRSFDDMHASGGQFIAASNRMQQRLEDMLRKANAMNWDSEARMAYDAIQLRFNQAYSDLRGILFELGGNVGQVATNHQDTENYLANNVWG